jgi:hypothetical protein
MLTVGAISKLNDSALVMMLNHPDTPESTIKIICAQLKCNGRKL